MNNCVAINVIAHDRILNNKGIPILFYWDGKSNVLDDLKNQQPFIDFINSRVMNADNYADSVITFFCFTEDEQNNWEEKYQENIISIQELFPLSEQSDSELAMSYVFKINVDLYNKVFASEYKKTVASNKSNVQSIYASIKSKYGTRVTKQTYIEYVRSELAKLDIKLTKQNLECIIKELTELIKNNN